MIENEGSVDLYKNEEDSENDPESISDLPGLSGRYTKSKQQ